MPNPTTDRERHRRAAAEHSALIDLLDELYPLQRLPDLQASDRSIGEWLGQRKLIERLKTLRREALEGTSGSLPNVIGGR